MWIHIPSSVSSAESVDLTSESAQLSRLARSLTWKGKSRAPASWQKELQKVYWTRLLSTLTLEPSQQKSLLERWMESSGVSHVSPSVLPDSREVPTIPETCGPIPSDSFARYDRASHSWKTYQTSLFINQDTSEQYSETWPKQGTMRNGAVSKQVMSEPHTGGKGSSSWPTARVSDTEGGIASNVEMKEGSFSRVNAQGVRWGVKLKDAVANWPTPATRDYKGQPGTTVMKKGRFVRVSNQTGTEFGAGLDGAATNWPTPATRDWKGMDPPGKKNARMNPELYLSIPQDRKIHDGDGSLSTTPNSHQHSVKCMRLNPKFVSWIMLGKSRIGWLR